MPKEYLGIVHYFFPNAHLLSSSEQKVRDLPVAACVYCASWRQYDFRWLVPLLFMHWMSVCPRMNSTLIKVNHLYPPLTIPSLCWRVLLTIHSEVAITFDTVTFLQLNQHCESHSKISIYIIVGIFRAMRWLHCMPKCWNSFNLRCAQNLEAERPHQRPWKPKDKKIASPSFHQFVTQKYSSIFQPHVTMTIDKSSTIQSQEWTGKLVNITQKCYHLSRFSQYDALYCGGDYWCFWGKIYSIIRVEEPWHHVVW
jgi:hypothetical protein